ncbi:hypothetical protein SDC9_135777 [bioreactor metagenome]|uniref:Uncharacterized protein n=1 Tax=bioreactor metagenome TaxID=1076179 RepID=A0A645DIN1_9ZZZZ
MRALLYHGFHHGTADISHGGEAKADCAAFRRKACAGEVHVRREHLDSVVARAVDVTRDSVHRTQKTVDQRG